MRLSVILPAYNAEAYIEEAIESVLNQDFTDFEFIIINDGSKDRTEDIIMSFVDSRIVYVKQENLGLILTLNKGIGLAKGEFIARMDADDICDKQRFSKQLEVLKNNPNIIVCGSQVRFIGDTTAMRFPFRAYQNDKDCKNWLVRQPCFAHPSVMLRKSAMVDNTIFYDINYKNAEDYKLWIDLADFGEFYNIQEPLLNYRISVGQITSKTDGVKEATARRCRKHYLKKYYPMIAQCDKVDLNLIRLAKKNNYNENKHLLTVLYRSCDANRFYTLLYFLVSLDFLRLDVISTLSIFKSLILNRVSRFI